jgi:hypothetical protein
MRLLHEWQRHRRKGLADELGREGADSGELVPEPRVLEAQVVLLQ